MSESAFQPGRRPKSVDFLHLAQAHQPATSERQDHTVVAGMDRHGDRLGCGRWRRSTSASGSRELHWPARKDVHDQQVVGQPSPLPAGNRDAGILAAPVGNPFEGLELALRACVVATALSSAPMAGNRIPSPCEHRRERRFGNLRPVAPHLRALVGRGDTARVFIRPLGCSVPRGCCRSTASGRLTSNRTGNGPMC